MKKADLVEHPAVVRAGKAAAVQVAASVEVPQVVVVVVAGVKEVEDFKLIMTTKTFKT